MELQRRLPDLAAQGLGVAVITYDPPAVLKRFADAHAIGFPLLSDAGSTVIKAYGLLNTTVEPESAPTACRSRARSCSTAAAG